MKRNEVDLPEIETGKYLHTKSGNYYEVLGVALQTETGEPLVIYSPLYDNKYSLFARPYNMFTEKINLDGTEALRFEKVDD